MAYAIFCRTVAEFDLHQAPTVKPTTGFWFLRKPNPDAIEFNGEYYSRSGLDRVLLEYPAATLEDISNCITLEVSNRQVSCEFDSKDTCSYLLESRYDDVMTSFIHPDFDAFTHYGVLRKYYYVGGV